MFFFIIILCLHPTLSPLPAKKICRRITNTSCQAMEPTRKNKTTTTCLATSRCIDLIWFCFFLDTLLSDFLQLFFIVSFEFKKFTAFFIVLLVAVVRTPLKLCMMDQALATLLEPSATRQLRMALNLK